MRKRSSRRLFASSWAPLFGITLLGWGISAIAQGAAQPTPAAAESKPTAAESLVPTGPVTLSADHAEWVQGGEMKYEGNVSLKSDTLQLNGDAMTVTQSADGQFSAHINGHPAQLKHLGVAGAQGASAETVEAQAGTIDYDSAKGLIRLTDSAHLQRGKDEVNGEVINYLVVERRIQAAGGQSGQVRIVIQPPPPKPAKPEAATTPQPAAPDTAAPNAPSDSGTPAP